MLKNLIRFSIDHAALVLVLAGVLLGTAAYRLPRTPVDVFPELNAPTVVVLTENENSCTHFGFSQSFQRTLAS